MADDQMQSGAMAVDELVHVEEPLADGQVAESAQARDAAVEDGGTRLPADPAIAELADHGRDDFISVVRDHPDSSLCWALLAEGALLAGTEEADIAGYSYAVTGFHAGISALRAAGWQVGDGIAWEHLTNQGFLRCVWARSVAADRIGQTDESTRCEQFLHQVSEPAWQQLHTTLVPADPADPADVEEHPGDDE